MNVLKLTLQRNILNKNPKSIKLIQYKRLFSTKNDDIKPILLSYASYESTQSTLQPIPPLIIMHGFLGSKGNWNSLCKAMQSKSDPPRKIIAVDARNHGDSPHVSSHSYIAMAEDVKYLMESQNISKAILLGHSMGGKAMMCFALKYPELVDRLIIEDISHVTNTKYTDYTYTFFEAMQNIKIAPNIPLSSARRQADTDLTKTVSDKGVRAFLLTNLVQKEDGSYIWRINIPALMSSYQNLLGFPDFGAAQYNGPTLFIRGATSDFIQKNDIIAIKKLFPKVNLVTIEGAGHWVHSEKPNEFLTEILKFIK